MPWALFNVAQPNIAVPSASGQSTCRTRSGPRCPAPPHGKTLVASDISAGWGRRQLSHGDCWDPPWPTRSLSSRIFARKWAFKPRKFRLRDISRRQKHRVPSPNSEPSAPVFGRTSGWSKFGSAMDGVPTASTSFDDVPERPPPRDREPTVAPTPTPNSELRGGPTPAPEFRATSSSGLRGRPTTLCPELTPHTQPKHSWSLRSSTCAPSVQDGPNSVSAISASRGRGAVGPRCGLTPRAGARAERGTRVAFAPHVLRGPLSLCAAVNKCPPQPPRHSSGRRPGEDAAEATSQRVQGEM